MTEHQQKLIAASTYSFVLGEGWYRSGRLIPEHSAVSALRRLLGDTTELWSAEELQNAALSAPQPPPTASPANLLENSSYLRHFYWRSAGGNLVVYYSPTESAELVALQLSQEETHRPFLNALREVPGWLDQFLEDYSAQPNKKLTVDGYASQIFRSLLLMPSQQLAEEPASLSWNKQEYAFKHFDPASLQELPKAAAWEQFLSRLSNREVFLAFVWSIFEPKNHGRQVLWLRGPGNDGKSRVISAISRYLGSRAVAALSQGTVSSQFFSSFVYGKRLVVFGDCMHTRLISTSAIHTLVGGDYASIEAKGKQAFPGRIYSRVIVGSNYAPEIDNTANQISRILYLTVAPLAAAGQLPGGDDTSFEDLLVAEMPSLLYAAREAYEKRCPNHGRITLSDAELDQILLHTKSDIQEFVERFCAENLVPAEGHSTSVHAVNNFFMFSARGSGLSVNQSLDLNLLNRYLEEKMRLSKQRENGLRVWRGVKMSTAFEAHMAQKVLA